VPTHYARDGRGVRGAVTQGQWRAGRIRNLVVNPVYKGSLTYGRRIDQRSPRTAKRGHEIITARYLVGPMRRTKLKLSQFRLARPWQGTRIPRRKAPAR
jgi:hypothetical protein